MAAWLRSVADLQLATVPAPGFPIANAGWAYRDSDQEWRYAAPGPMPQRGAHSIGFEIAIYQNPQGPFLQQGGFAPIRSLWTSQVISSYTTWSGLNARPSNGFAEQKEARAVIAAALRDQQRPAHIIDAVATGASKPTWYWPGIRYDALHTLFLLALLLAAVAILRSLVISQRELADQRLAQNLCPNCAYPLSGLRSSCVRCPECGIDIPSWTGLPIAATSTPPPPRRAWPNARYALRWGGLLACLFIAYRKWSAAYGGVLPSSASLFQTWEFAVFQMNGPTIWNRLLILIAPLTIAEWCMCAIERARTRRAAGRPSTVPEAPGPGWGNDAKSSRNLSDDL